MNTTLSPETKIVVVNDDNEVIRKNSISNSLCQGRPRSTPSASNLLNVEDHRAHRPRSFSTVLHDIEERTTAQEARKLKELLNTMKQVKSNTLLRMIFETVLYHMCVYVADIITDILNGYQHLDTGNKH
jgi:hypothetical protein